MTREAVATVFCERYADRAFGPVEKASSRK